LEGKTAIVTGALGLIGKELCRALDEAGASVVVTDLNDDACREFANELSERALGKGADITDPGSLEELRRFALERRGAIDVLVNNAAINDKFEDPKGAFEQSMFENYPLELWEASMKVNVTGTFLCCQILGAPMAERGGGSVINVASTYGLVGPDQSLYRNRGGEQTFYKTPAYPATKGAVVNFTRFLAAYWGEKGVRVNTLTPGGVEAGQDEFFIENYSKKTPLKRMAKTKDYRGAVVFLASDASEYVTGANLVVDGGFTAW
jgi:NAD(P)-dependent dehydrogenase (short-subunit alcohol dehydrogenase family)